MTETHFESKKEPDQDGATTISNSSDGGNKFSDAWTNALLKIRKPVTVCLLKISNLAARNPITTVSATISLSLVILAIGLFTNFHLETDSDVLWTPTPSDVLSHGSYLNDDAGYPTPPRFTRMTVHANGDNVLSQEGIERVFTALDVVQNTQGYSDVCKKATVYMTDLNNDKTCFITSPTRFWNYNLDEFLDTVSSDDDAIKVLSQESYPSGTPVDLLSILGHPKKDASGILTSAELYSINIALPPNDESFDLEKRIIDNVLELQDTWDTESENMFLVEIFTQRSFDDEFERAIADDIPLVPMIFFVMSTFTCLIFFRRNWVQSRTILGFGAVVTVLLSIICGYGILFIVGVPFTSMTQVLPFIMFGIGLDDAFILWGAYQRTDKTKESVERIHDTILEVGVSIFLTTATSIVAFSLGSVSSVPAVYWLCQYATPTIAIDFLLQITFFVALIVLDERRVEKKRRDFLVCFAAPESRDRDANDDEEETEEQPEILVNEDTIFDKFMKWFGAFLMEPVVKVFVIIIFSSMFGVLAYSATKLQQEFDFTDVLPSESYVADFWGTYTTFSAVSGIEPEVVFRNVDQSVQEVQEQMESYVNDIVSIRSISNQPAYFWLRDFQKFLSSSDDDTLKSSPFTQQLDVFLSDPTFNQLYKDDIVRDDQGNIVTSRVRVRMDNVDQEDVVQQIDTLEDQRIVSESQALNQGKSGDEWAFFTFDDLYYIWQFYTECPNELLLSTILGISSVSLIALIFIPHWSAILFIGPIITMLYIDLLGFLQLCGVPINAVSYISLVMSIGLMVDFIMHILLRYYESKRHTREEKVKDTLQEMGTSILIGAISTFLGVIPLALSSSNIFSTIFLSFMGLVLLGATHGLIFLPVMLSLLGPTAVLNLSPVSEDAKKLQEHESHGDDSENTSTVQQSV